MSSRFVASFSLLVFLPLAAAAQLASFEDQVAAYLRRFPYQVTYDYTVRYTRGEPLNLNSWMPKGEPTLVRAGDDIVPRTNNDTFSKGAALSLADGPVVLEATAPTRERFNSFQLVDDRNANFRNIVHPAGKYTLYFGKRPAVFEGEAIEVPSPFAIVVARVEVRDKGDPADVAAARAVYLGMKIAGVPPAEFPRLDLLSEFSADVVAEAKRRMDEVFETVRFTETVVGPGKEPGREVSVLYHAAGTKGGWGAPDPAHSAYEAVFRDANGSELRGRDGPYAVTTEAPPVDAFWSVTVYDTERGGRLHPNSANRYHVNDTTAARNADETVTFTFALACAPEADNCLEVPPGRFDVTIRYFLPREPIILGAWRFPAIQRLADFHKNLTNY